MRTLRGYQVSGAEANPWDTRRETRKTTCACVDPGCRVVASLQSLVRQSVLVLAAILAPFEEREPLSSCLSDHLLVSNSFYFCLFSPGSRPARKGDIRRIESDLCRLRARYKSSWGVKRRYDKRSVICLNWSRGKIIFDFFRSWRGDLTFLLRRKFRRYWQKNISNESNILAGKNVRRRKCKLM